MKNMKQNLIPLLLCVLIAGTAAGKGGRGGRGGGESPLGIGPLPTVPLIASVGAAPNIMFLLDSSGSMQHIVIDAPYDENTTYVSCPSSLQLSNTRTIYAYVKKRRGVPVIKFDSRLYDWGTTSGTGATRRSKRCFNNNVLYTSMLYANAYSSSLKMYYPSGSSGTTLYSGNYLNWYFGVGTNQWGNDARNKPGTERRIDVERSVTSDIINGLSNVRVGLARLNTSGGLLNYGAKIKVAIDDIEQNRSTMLNKIQEVPASGGTPLAGALHQIGRYYIGNTSNTLTMNPDQTYGPLSPQMNVNVIFNKTPAYDSGVSSTSPIQYFCQKNFVVLITDGRPTSDQQNIVASTGLRDYDNDCLNANPACLTFDRKPNYVYSSSGSDFLDDVGAALYDMDLRPDLTNNEGQPSKTNISTYAVGFSDLVVQGDPLLHNLAAQSGGQYLEATNSAELLSVFNQITSEITAQVGLASSASFNGASLSAGSALFLSQFNTLGWTGDVIKYSLDQQGNMGSAAYHAKDVLDAKPPSSRVMITYNQDTGNAVDFSQLNNLSATQQADLNRAPNGRSDGLGQQRLDYLRGERTLENNPFRVRQHVLADIVHSNALYVGKPESKWPDIAPFPTAVGERFSDYKVAQMNRTPMLYTGDNGGIFHGFNADTGDEKLAYLPANLFTTDAQKGYHYLTDPLYQHRFMLDLPPIATDVYLNSSWHTVVMGGERAGGKGYFLLDVTNPNSPSPTNTFKWEFTSDDDPDLGYTYSEPVIGLMNNGRWAAIFGNGYNSGSSNKHALLFIVYLDGPTNGSWQKGTDYIVLDTQKDLADNTNGLASPAAVDLDENGTIDRFYAGDLEGHMWAFDVSSNDDSQWKVAYGPQNAPHPLFSAPGTTHAITAKPIVMRHPEVANSTAPSNSPNVMVYFGTGRYLTEGDKSTTPTESVYAVWDKGVSDHTVGHLVEQGMITETADKRVVSNNAVNYTGNKYGWYLNFTPGERIITTPLLRHGILYFNTMIPDASVACSFGGSGWMMGVNLLNGGEPEYSVFDINGDGVVDELDQLGQSAISGIKISEGIPSQPSLRGDYLFTPVSDGSMKEMKTLNSTPLTGRISWRDLSP